MAVNIIKFDSEARESILSGLDIAYRAVRTTLGSRGKNVTIQHYSHISETQKFNIQNTKDGVTVIKSLFSNDPEIQLGMDLMKQVCDKTVKEVGDGTTTTAILFHSIFSSALRSWKENSYLDINKVRRGILIGLDRVLEELDKLAMPIDSRDRLHNIAMISSNGDRVISDMVTELIYEGGKDVSITVKKSLVGKTYMEQNKGLTLNRGYYSPIFLEKEYDRYKVLEDVVIFSTTEELTYLESIRPVFEYVQGVGKSLLLIAKDFKPNFMNQVITIKEKGLLKDIMLVKAPDFDFKSYEKLVDLHRVFGGAVVSRFDNIDFSDVVRSFSIKNADKPGHEKFLGYSPSVRVSIEKTVLEFPEMTEELRNRIEDRCREIELKIESEGLQDTYDRDWMQGKLRDRISSLRSTLSTIYVHANSEVELNEIRDRIDDCIHSVKSAMEMGYVPGGGRTLHFISTSVNLGEGLSGYELLGVNILRESLVNPIYSIIGNAIINPDRVIYSLESMDLVSGYNVDVEGIVNLLDSGIIDSVKVIQTALRNAVSMASTLITTDCLILNSAQIL